MGDSPFDDAGPGGGPPAYVDDEPTNALLSTMRVQELDRSGVIWLIVAIVGFFLGLMVITGPLVWWQTSRLSNRFRTAGLSPSGPTSVAHVLGILTTILGVLSLFFFAAVLFLGLGALIALG